MDPDYFIQTLDYIARARKAARKVGMKHLQSGKDFDQFRKIVRSTGQNLSEHFDDRYVDRLYLDAMWVVGRDKNNKVIATAAMRCDELGKTTLAQFLKGHLRRLNGGRPTITSPGPEEISGRLVYTGMYWLDEAFRNRGLAPAFSGLIQSMILMKWDPDAHWGLMSKKLAEDGFGIRSFFVHSEPHAIEFAEGEDPIYPKTYHLHYNRAENLYWLVRPGRQAFGPNE